MTSTAVARSGPGIMSHTPGYPTDHVFDEALYSRLLDLPDGSKMNAMWFRHVSCGFPNLQV